jgi:glycosyltransferase involved in cell wall biosynthesis
MNSDRIAVIIPCYNEAKRLEGNLQRLFATPYLFVFVDDGSHDGTKELLDRSVRPPHRVVHLPANRGKAEAVRQGMLALEKLPDYSTIGWAGYWDADMATPIEELPRFLIFAEFQGTDPDAIYGSRWLRLGSTIKRLFVRHLLGRIFCTVTDTVFKLKCYDTQCGAKLFRRAALADAFGEPFISRWLFDIEILLRLKRKQYRQIEYPLTCWTDVKGSKLNVMTSVFGVGIDIARIHRHYVRQSAKT